MDKFTKSLKDLKMNQCRWPEGGLKTRLLFCGENIAHKDTSYCQHHLEKSLSTRKKKTTIVR